MTYAEPGDTVKIHYTAKLEDGEIFDTSSGKDPVQFTLGEKQVMPGIEEAVLGMAEGQSKTHEIQPDKAYGEPKQELIVRVDRNQFPEEMNPDVGQHLRFSDSHGREIIARVIDVTDDAVTVDANHPLAGEKVTFDIELLEVSKPAPEIK